MQPDRSRVWRETGLKLARCIAFRFGVSMGVAWGMSTCGCGAMGDMVRLLERVKEGDRGLEESARREEVEGRRKEKRGRSPLAAMERPAMERLLKWWRVVEVVAEKRWHRLR